MPTEYAAHLIHIEMPACLPGRSRFASVSTMRPHARHAFSRLHLLAALVVLPAVVFAAEPRAKAARPKTAARVQVKGQRVSLIPPEGFTETAGFNGFESELMQAFILVMEFPMSHEAALAGFVPEALEKAGMKELSRERVKAGAHAGHFLQVSKHSESERLRKCVLLLSHGSTTLMVSATWPEVSPKGLAEALEAAVRSTQWEPVAAPPAQRAAPPATTP